MADYQLTNGPDGALNPNIVIRTIDQAFVSYGSPGWVEYEAWLLAGGVPDPVDSIVPPIADPTPVDQVLFDHENRLRTIEGEPPLTLDDFITKTGL